MAYLRSSMGIMAVKGEVNGMVFRTIMTIMVILVSESVIVKRVMEARRSAGALGRPTWPTRTNTDAADDEAARGKWTGWTVRVEAALDVRQSNGVRAVHSSEHSTTGRRAGIGTRPARAWQV